jgi:chemotaxis regulatin CheY-phosphate phosphatase CheZ
MPRYGFEEIKNYLELIRRLGHQCVIPARREEWDEFCNKYKESGDLPMLAQIANIMRQLKSSSSDYGWDSITKRAHEEISHSGVSWSYVVKNVARFSPFGVSYAIAASNISLSDEVIEQLTQLDKENKAMMPKEEPSRKCRYRK